MDRNLWTGNLTATWCPSWGCSICRKGTITLVQKTLVSHETVLSKRAHSHDDWDPEWIKYTFSAWGQCSNQSCKQTYTISGTGTVELEINYEGNAELADCFWPLLCYPMPDIIALPSRCPSNVREELRAAFALFWLNPAACAGRIRVALEKLMNYLGVPKRKKGARGKFQELTLHGRIELFAAKNSTVGSQLMALKWLGNTGSHDKVVSKGDILDAFEILEHALGEVIDKRTEKVAALVKSLTKKHGSK